MKPKIKPDFDEEDDEDEPDELTLNDKMKILNQNLINSNHNMKILNKNFTNLPVMRQITVGDVMVISQNPIKDINRIMKNPSIKNYLDVYKLKKQLKETPSYIE